MFSVVSEHTHIDKKDAFDDQPYNKKQRTFDVQQASHDHNQLLENVDNNTRLNEENAGKSQ